MINQELSKKILDNILEHPEQHSQASWGLSLGACGSTMCVAGWACQLSEGVEIVWEEAGEGSPFVATADSATVNGRTMRIDRAAKRLLGLDERQAWNLFYESTNAEAVTKLKHMADTGAF